VVYIRNHCQPVEINENLKKKLDRQLGIVESGFMDKIKDMLTNFIFLLMNYPLPFYLILNIQS
jgi:hypothetical protein